MDVDGAGSRLQADGLVGGRLPGDQDGRALGHDLRQRLAGRVQLSTDGHQVYPAAIEDAFGADVDYARLVKEFRGEAEVVDGELVYGRQQLVGSTKERVVGSPKVEDVSTSHVERQNLTMRMGLRRFTRRTKGFSKRIECHRHAVTLYFTYYNFVRPHRSLGGATPARAAGLGKRPRDMAWLVGLIVN